jgi:hypothetical protein
MYDIEIGCVSPPLLVTTPVMVLPARDTPSRSAQTATAVGHSTSVSVGGDAHNDGACTPATVEGREK